MEGMSEEELVAFAQHTVVNRDPDFVNGAFVTDVIMVVAVIDPNNKRRLFSVSSNGTPWWAREGMLNSAARFITPTNVDEDEEDTY